MNPLRPPSSSSRQVRAGNGRVGKGTAGQGRGAPAAAVAGQFGVVAGAVVAPTVDGSSEAAAASPTLPSFEAGYLPAWWTSSSPMGSNEGDQHKLFAEKQEGARKDVECAFGILQSRFCILRRPARLFEQGDLHNIMVACIILHNMIIEDEKDIEQVPFDLNEEGSTYIVEEATITHGENPEMEDVINRNATLHNRPAHKQLQSDLIEHIWHKFGNVYMANPH